MDKEMMIRTHVKKCMSVFGEIYDIEQALDKLSVPISSVIKKRDFSFLFLPE